MQTETIVISGTQFDKVQGKIYVDIRGKKCQVKEKFSLNDTYSLIEKFKSNG